MINEEYLSTPAKKLPKGSRSFNEFISIIGGASKLLKHFRKEHSGSIISYCNRRFSNGGIYRTLGFALKCVTDLNYFYTSEPMTF